MEAEIRLRIGTESEVECVGGGGVGGPSSEAWGVVER